MPPSFANGAAHQMLVSLQDLGLLAVCLSLPMVGMRSQSLPRLNLLKDCWMCVKTEIRRDSKINTISICEIPANSLAAKTVQQNQDVWI